MIVLVSLLGLHFAVQELTACITNKASSGLVDRPHTDKKMLQGTLSCHVKSVYSNPLSAMVYMLITTLECPGTLP